MYRDYGKPLGIPALPSASQLMQDLLVDPEALKNERHDPGIYDEDGDYYPQYSDDPEHIQAILEASRPEQGGTDGGAEVSSDDSASTDIGAVDIPISSENGDHYQK